MNNIEVTISVPQSSLFMFTTLLQSGVIIKCPAGKSIACFLNQLPSFTEEYIVDVIQTIFLDGDPADDLELGFTKEQQTLALSASMPGLAGAILRRNSFHSALRSKVAKISPDNLTFKETTVTLKLFNSIAQERGPYLLASGVVMSCEKVLKFFTTRSTLLEKSIYIEVDENQIDKDDFLQLLRDNSSIRLFIRGTDGE